MTPYQLRLYVQNYQERKKEELENKKYELEHQRQLTYLCALWTSRFVWQKKAPTYEQVTKDEKKRMTPEEIFEQVKRQNQSLGGTTY